VKGKAMESTYEATWSCVVIVDSGSRNHVNNSLHGVVCSVVPHAVVPSLEAPAEMALGPRAALLRDLFGDLL
jgi:hypothetical protein